MRALLLLSLVGLSYATDYIFFDCTSKDLLPLNSESFTHITRDDANGPYFKLDVSNRGAGTDMQYTPGQPIFLTLRNLHPLYAIKAAIIQVVEHCTECESVTPIGTFTVASGSGADVGHCMADNDKVIINAGSQLWNEVGYITWMLHDDAVDEIDIIASVVDGNNNLHTGIVQHKFHYDPHTRGETVEHDLHDPHTNPLEFEEKERNPDLEEEGEGRINSEEYEEEGPFENPNEGEEREEKEREESLARDRQGDDDHGFREETDLQLKYQEEEAARIREEELEGEADWVRKQYEQEEEDKNEFDREMHEYEVEMAEEERKRMEIIAWEIKDKEEYDQLMREEEKEKESNKTPKDDDNDVEVPKDEVEINIKEEIFIKDSGCATLVASISVLLSALFVLFV